MPIPSRNGFYTGQQFTNELGERYVWIGSEWRPAGNDNYTPVQNPREVNVTFNTFLEEGGNPVQVKVLVNGNDWADSTSTNGKCTLKFFDYQILNPTEISFLGNNVKTKKRYTIQARVNQENDVVINEIDESIGNLPIPPNNGEIFTLEPSLNFTRLNGGGGGGFNFGGSGGATREVNPNDFRGAGYGIADMAQRENIQ